MNETQPPEASLIDVHLDRLDVPVPIGLQEFGPDVVRGWRLGWLEARLGMAAPADDSDDLATLHEAIGELATIIRCPIEGDDALVDFRTLGSYILERAKPVDPGGNAVEDEGWMGTAEHRPGIGHRVQVEMADGSVYVGEYDTMSGGAPCLRTADGSIPWGADATRWRFIDEPTG